MKTYGIFETKNKLSELCETVAVSGEHVVVTRHGIPLVRIVPYEEGAPGGSVWDTVRESQEKYGALVDEFDLPERLVGSNRTDPLGEPE